eukprot:scaffold39899_cov60-Phaeocystis_antarctica.AAC.1
MRLRVTVSSQRSGSFGGLIFTILGCIGVRLRLFHARLSRRLVLVLVLVHAVNAHLDDTRVEIERREPHRRIDGRRGFGALVVTGVLAFGGAYTGAFGLSACKLSGGALALEGRVRQPAPEPVALYAVAEQTSEVAAPMAAALRLGQRELGRWHVDRARVHRFVLPAEPPRLP